MCERSHAHALIFGIFLCRTVRLGCDELWGRGLVTLDDAGEVRGMALKLLTPGLLPLTWQRISVKVVSWNSIRNIQALISILTITERMNSSGVERDA